ncbi:hypothetical protein PR202_gb13891 [Eleusine coracana subsp. coracana]|uniref:Reverse transcriptase zinc-binding domain-containing protein n=1 Tax=Eleusine coracana subsp. coracana TaxID=191504 RepID=A0AAV5EU17_ELECO|nr:hypothetical protein PR202_gb13891 [Eleusine coracana subsp. coracana]
MTSYVFARQVWHEVLTPLGLQNLAPRRHTNSFAEWWRKAIKQVHRNKKGINTLIILTAWSLWRHKNSCVFEGARPTLPALLSMIKDEHRLWCLARAKGLRSLNMLE